MAAVEQESNPPLLGKNLDEVDPPAAVLDLAKLEVNCRRMFDTVVQLGLGWRAHVKTHKVPDPVFHINDISALYDLRS
jgi:D-serine deaminase-like pyridoxal phosphate-dependent protein